MLVGFLTPKLLLLCSTEATEGKSPAGIIELLLSPVTGSTGPDRQPGTAGGAAVACHRAGAATPLCKLRGGQKVPKSDKSSRKS